MAICTGCGRENDGFFSFCPDCGARLVHVSLGQEQRKTVTVVFCDVVGSTALGESVDPEVLRGLLARYFARMRGIVESHGGTVEKFIGDAVMAVFGVPAAHDDDALRACRAAVAMAEAFSALGVVGRVGVNTGEVVTGTEERLATGDVVNVAARLQQEAAPGEVLLGESTFAFVRGAADCEPVEPLALKGKRARVAAFRLLGVGEPSERPHDTAFVGRERELELLAEAWDRVQRERRCELVTVVGEPGVGKSRLIAEALAQIDGLVARGHCLPYGDGITYWPVVEVVKQLDALPSDPAAAAAVGSLLRESEAATSSEEIAWAFRRLLEEQSQLRPLLVCFDDLQWGEERFLELVEQLALLATDAPILVLCLARPDLVERRPEWPVALRLEPLADAEIRQLLPEQLGEEVQERIARAAGGNPLFVVEMLAMLAETGGEVVVPPTLQALLAARLDQLEPAERGVLERAAVEGERFHRGALQELAPDEPQVTVRLATLVRRGFVRPERAQIVGEEGFRFCHLLIRDAAYAALPKSLRAELHERFAGWLERQGRELVELDELLGYHLEQAARYRAELGAADADLAVRAGERLAAAGRRASWRGDWSAAASLLDRALSLTRPVRADIALELDLAVTLRQADPQRALAVAEAAARQADASGDRVGALAARLAAGTLELMAPDASAVSELEALAREALPLFEQAGDHAALVHAWWALAAVANFRLRHEDNARAHEQLLRHARLAGQRVSHLYGLPIALVLGPRPADQALRTLAAISPGGQHPVTLLAAAWLTAMLARFAEASRLAAEAAQRYREVLADGLEAWPLAEIAALSGDHARAAALLSDLNQRLEERGELAYLSSYAPLVGRWLCALDRHDEAEPLAAQGRELGNEQDTMTQALWRQAQALIEASRGRHRDAEALARDAVKITEQTDALNLQGDALCDLAEVLAASGRTDEAADALRAALERYERKRNIASAASARQRLTALATAARA